MSHVPIPRNKERFGEASCGMLWDFALGGEGIGLLEKQSQPGLREGAWRPEGEMWLGLGGGASVRLAWELDVALPEMLYCLLCLMSPPGWLPWKVIMTTCSPAAIRCGAHASILPGTAACTSLSILPFFSSWFQNSGSLQGMFRRGPHPTPAALPGGPRRSPAAAPASPDVRGIGIA